MTESPLGPGKKMHEKGFGSQARQITGQPAEPGIACVTGIPDATSLIHAGDTVTVDGYLGIVTIG